MIFAKLYKKRGFHETLYSLYTAQNYSLTLPQFFEKLEEKDSYYNAFFRIKQEMLKYDIISYKKNRYKEKVLSLTKKGVGIVKILKNIDEFLSLDFEEYTEKMKKLKKQKIARQRKLMLKNEKKK